MKAIISAELVFDDKNYIKKAPIFNRKASVIDVLKTGFDGGHFDHHDSLYYRPFVTLTFYLEKRIIGFNAKTLHLTNVIIYILGIIIVYLFLLRQNLKPYSAEFITLLFAISPINVDNVVWIVSRYDLFLLLFGFLSLYLLDLGIDKRRKIYYILSILFFAMGMFSKETFLIWFLYLPVYEFFKRKTISFYYHIINFLIIVSFFIIKNGLLYFGTLSLNLKYSFLGYLKLIIFSLGAYFKFMIFPFILPKFYFVVKFNLLYIFLAFLFIVFFILVSFLSLKQKKLLFPLVLFIISFSPYIYLIFTELAPLIIFPRYMLIPYFAFLWLVFLLFFEKLKNKIKIGVLGGLFFLFVFFDIQSIYVYKSELDYWKYSYNFNKKSSYVAYSLAASYYENKNPIFAEFYLKKALKYSMRKSTAYYISLLFSSIEIKKANYQNAFQWITKLNKLEKMFYIPLYLKIEKLFKIESLYLYEGVPYKAEKVLLTIKKMKPYNLLVYQKLFNFYCSYKKWNSALMIEREVKNKFMKNVCCFNTLKIKRMVEEMTDTQKVIFYMSKQNYRSAAKLLESLEGKTERDYFLLLEAYLRVKETNKASELIANFLKDRKDYLARKKLGFFFLKSMYRVKDALYYFKESLKLKPDQPQLKTLLNYLEKLNLD